MAQDYETKLRKDRDAAMDALSELAMEMQRLEWRIDYINGLLAKGPKPSRKGKRQPPVKHREKPMPRWTTVKPETLNGGKYADMTAPQAIAAVLEEAAQPLRIKQITERAMDHGFDQSADFRKVFSNFSSVLSRASRDPDQTIFKKVGRGTFTLHKLAGGT